MSVNDTLAPHELIGGDDLKKLLRAVERIQQITNRPLRVWEMRMFAASTMECLEEITDTVAVP
jgi:hypothetical protein